MPLHVCTNVYKGVAHLLLQVILAAKDSTQLLEAMSDITQLKVVPLLQGILFGR